jgi:hypothetical protein
MKILRNCSAAGKLLAGASLALGACHHTSPQQQAVNDDHDIALVKQAQRQKPPVVPVQPEPVSFAELSNHNDSIPLPDGAKVPRPGEGCTFSVHGTTLLVIVPKFGLARFSGRIEVFGADSGSPTIKGGLHVKYSGSEHALELDQSGGSVRIVIRDKFDRPAYAALGDLACPAGSGDAGSDPT